MLKQTSFSQSRKIDSICTNEHQRDLCAKLNIKNRENLELYLLGGKRALVHLHSQTETLLSPT